MKKITVALVAATMIVAALVAGCGKKPESGGAKAILDKSQAAAREVKSLKATGDALIKTPESEVKETRMSFEMESNVISDTDVEARITATDEDGSRTDAYIVDGWAYSSSPETGWVKQKIDGAQELGTGALLTPNQVSEFSKYAENAKQLADEGGNFVISFDLGTSFFDQAFEAAGKSDGSAPDQEMLEMAKALLETFSMKMVLKIDKKTYYPGEATMKIAADAVPMLGNADITLKMAFTGYNKPVEIVLPAEARAAVEMPEGTSGGLPGIPGLGL